MVIDINEYIINYEKYYDKSIEINYDSYNDKTKVLLEKLTKKNINEYICYAWEQIIDSIPAKYLTQNIVKYLLENKIAFEILCYKDVSNEILKKIYNTDNNIIDALIILGKRLLLKDEFQLTDLCTFITDYRNDLLYDTLLKYLIILFINSQSNEIIFDKAMSMVDVMIEITENNDIKKVSYDTRSFLIAYNEKDINNIDQFSNTNDSLILLALSLNDYTPDNVLKKLLKVKNGKYSRIIRKNAKQRLS